MVTTALKDEEEVRPCVSDLNLLTKDSYDFDVFAMENDRLEQMTV